MNRSACRAAVIGSPAVAIAGGTAGMTAAAPGGRGSAPGQPGSMIRQGSGAGGLHPKSEIPDQLISGSRTLTIEWATGL